MNLSKCDKNREKAAINVKPMINWKSKIDAYKKLYNDLISFGVKLPD